MGVRAYEKTGFKESGRRRQSRRSGGELRDEIFMQCLSDEFESLVLGRTFAPDGSRLGSYPPLSFLCLRHRFSRVLISASAPFSLGS